ncbi:MAG: hypothetical protein NTW66_01990 [Candidatus Magasanikbacteria bacterium]|nr:hypothetical protein [Candidatus Magasanikbacteria bacterium]
MKRIFFPVLSAIAGALIFGLIGLLRFAGYGGNNCDVTGKSCDCFCCNMFGLRGYESCGDFGLIVGVLVGAVLGFVTHRLIKRFITK